MKPSIIVVDDYFLNPVAVREYALRQNFVENGAFYKGKRANVVNDGLWMSVEDMSAGIAALLRKDSLQNLYTCFQLTTEKEPLVYHSDHQRWAGAIYLDPTRIDAGTSFWRDRCFGNRRPSPLPQINSLMYSQYNLLHEDGWELVDRVGSVFNRLVLWDAQLVHSATTYTGFTDENPRLVQLLFFN